MRLLVCDDEEIYLNKIETVINNWSKKRGIEAEVNKFAIPGNAIKADIINEHQVALLDIEMKSMDGIELMDTLRKNNPELYVIFITNHDEYVSEAFHRDLYTYIFKKDLSHMLPKQLDRLWKDMNDGSGMFSYKIQRTEYMIRFDRIKYLQSDNHSVEINTCGGHENIRIYETLSSVRKRLPEAMFVKINRSNIINIKYVDEVTRESVIMDGNEELPVVGGSILEKVRKLRMSYR